MSSTAAEIATTTGEVDRWASFYEGKECVFEKPKLLAASVVHGFKRGSKDLGIPTANLNMDELPSDKSDMAPGIYFGFARLNDRTFETVVSVGWNPFYKNTVKTIEAHLLVTMEDFYGEHLQVLICGFLRDELNFDGLDDLISCIQTDINRSKAQLDLISEKYRGKASWNEFA